jgi:hypothetical protein
MAASSSKNSKDTGTHNDTTMDDDDVTVNTEKPTNKTDFIEAEMTDLNIRYEIPFRKGQSNDEDYKQHVKLLIAITTNFDKSMIRIYDNKNIRVKSFEEPKWQNKEYFEDHFTIHVAETQRKTVIVHRVMSKKTIADIKNEPSVSKHLKKSSTYLRGHFWKEDEVSLKDIGFLTTYVPTKHSKEYVRQAMYERCESTKGIEWSDAPAFQIIHAQPKIKLSGRKDPVKTHAFSVQVLSKDTAKMGKFLRKIYDTEHLYMPFSMKKQFPKAVASAILQQNKLIKDTWVIVLIGIPRHYMPQLKHNILAIPGVTGISETNRTDKSGRWNILVTDGSFKSNRKYLTANIKQWVIDMPAEELGPVVTGFPTPQVYQKHQYENDDDSSSGQASYMSSCAQSYGSVDGSVDEQFFDPPRQQQSYAAALTGASSTTSPTVTEVIIPQRGTHSNPSDKSAIDYNTVIAGLQANITIANLQAQVKSLQTQLLGVQTPSTVTASSAPEPEVNEDRMATLESNMALMATQFEAWMLEMRQARQDLPEQGTKHSQNDYIEQLPSSQRSKRADTRTTPNRTANPNHDPMDITDNSRIQLFKEVPSGTTTPPLSPGPVTQPIQPKTTLRTQSDSKRTRSPESPKFTDMATLLAASASPQYPEGYDSDDPEYVYDENEDGTLFCIGLAQPNDFLPDGSIRGPQPSLHDNDIAMMQIRSAFHPRDPSSEPILRSPSTDNTIATQDETAVNSTTSSPQGQPSLTPEARLPVMGSLESLLAEGAQTEHA